MSSGKGFKNPPAGSDADGDYNGMNMNMNPSEDDGWEEVRKKSNNKNKGSVSKQMGSQHSGTKAWGSSDNLQKLGMRSHGGSGRACGETRPPPPPDARKRLGRGFNKPNETLSPHYASTSAVVPPPLTHGWGLSSRAASSTKSEDAMNANASNVDEIDDGGEDSDDVDDSDDEDDELFSDGFDTDESQKSHGTRKENKWFKDLFQKLDELTVEMINQPERQWKCPACKGGPGAITWYRGLLPLISHAKTKKSTRVKLHRELAQLLEEELKIRGTSAVPVGEVFGKWQGLKEIADKEIVWPPMVVIMNTKLEKCENDKWIGMGNQELLDYFSAYSASKARHSYGPQGHRGMSLLIFEASAVGYIEAEHLSKHFEENCRDRVAWEGNRALFYSGGKRNLYGYMAEKRDMENFNQHSQGKSKVRYEMRSYQEMVVNQMKQMGEDNQQILWLKTKVAREQMNKKVLEGNMEAMTEKLRRTMDENLTVKLKTKNYHEQNKDEMDNQEQFFRDQIQQFYDNRNEKEENFEKLQQHERDKMAQSEANTSSWEECLRRTEAFIKLQDKEMEEFVTKREELITAHKERIMEHRRRQREEEMAIEKEFNLEFDKLMEEYTPKQQESPN